MLKKYQYKHFTKIKNFAFIPLRPLQFKRSKWLPFKLLWNARIKKKEDDNYVLRRNTKFFLKSKNKKKKKFTSRHKFLFQSRFPVYSRFFKLKLCKNLGQELKKVSVLSRRKKKKISFRTYFSNINYKLTKNFANKRSFLSSKKKNLQIFNKFKLFVMKGRFIHLSNLSKDKTQSKLKLKYLLNQQTPVVRREYKDRDLFISRLYQDNFCLNGASSSYYFSKTFREIKDKLKSNVILLNSQKLKHQIFLEKGDVLKFNTKNCISVKKNIKSYSSLNSLPSHMEADLYSQTIVSVKDSRMVSEADYHLMCLEYVNAQNI